MSYIDYTRYKTFILHFTFYMSVLLHFPILFVVRRMQLTLLTCLSCTVQMKLFVIFVLHEQMDYHCYH